MIDGAMPVRSENAMYDVVVNEHDGAPDGWKTDTSTGSRSRAVRRAREIAHAWPWQRRRIVRVVHGPAVIDFNVEP